MKEKIVSIFVMTLFITSTALLVGGTTHLYKEEIKEEVRGVLSNKTNDLIYHEGFESIWRMKADGSGQTQIIPDGWFAKYSPNFQQIAYGEFYNNGIWVMDANGANQVQITPNGSAPSWAPGGNKIVYFVGDTSVNRRIWIVDSNGNNPHKLTDQPGSFPDWSPDNEWIAFHGEIGTGIWIIQSNGQDLKNIHPDGGYPAWKPLLSGGLEMCYTDLSDGHYIWTMDVDTTAGTGFNHNNVSEYPGILPDWCANDVQIAYETGNPVTYEWEGIRIVDITGSPNDHLISSTGHAPDWGEKTPPQIEYIEIPGPVVVNRDADGVIKANDPYGDIVRYHIDWGDGESKTTDFHPSGVEVAISHTWTSQGDFTVKAKAEDSFGLLSPEVSIIVTVPKNKVRISSPIHNILLSNPNLYTILQRIILQLGPQ